ncbi:MAG: beta-N-acetylglucosaminidase domain-containing protein [Akkermansia sp.]|nr:beta-N-acetylglucosaminidase domain-containing protein [Akkermansia sp.]
MKLHLKSLFRTLCCAAPLLLATVFPLAKAVIIYPQPQHNGMRSVTTEVKDVQVIMRSSGDTSDMWKRLPDVPEGYAISITPGKVTIYANDETGVYYARQSIIQMLYNVPDATLAHNDVFADKTLREVTRLGPLPMGILVDWPDLPARGVVEGYYGAPWSFEARCSIFRFMGRNKMNTYIYAPKDDPYHHGHGCYQPYPTTKANELRDLVKYARQNHVRFVWAIHPANTVRWADNNGKKQLDALCDKLQQMYDLGVRDFGVLVDDSSGEIGKAERQVQLTNYILENFIRKHPDVNQTLIMCPTGYNRSWTNAQFLNTLGDGLDKSIPVMWTGDTVVHDITLNGQKWVNEHVKRPTFIWWNWPCNDFKRSRLSMGRTYGLDTDADMKNQMSGFVANPMEHAEASKVGLFGVANYTWNIDKFESQTTWDAGIHRLYPRHREAMKVFCAHNSYLLPNGHGYFREESAEIAETAQNFISSIAAGKPDMKTAQLLQLEFDRMVSAARELKHTTNPVKGLCEEIRPWLDQFELTGVAGASIMTALATEDAYLFHYFFDTVQAIYDMRSTMRGEWSMQGVRQVDDVEVAAYAMTPVLNATFAYLNDRVYADLSGKKRSTPKFSASVGNTNANVAKLTDGRPTTFWSNDRRQEAGQWYCLDQGSPANINNICLIMGGPRHNDHPQSVQFEASDDGEHWYEIGSPQYGNQAILNLAKQPVRARYIRFRILQPRPNWLSICEFSINKSLPPYVTSNIEGCHLSAYSNTGDIGINRVMEVATLKPQQHITLELPTPMKPEWIEINLENPNLEKWGNIRMTLESGQTVALEGKIEKNRLYLKKGEFPDARVTALSVTNQSGESQEIKVTIFRIGITEDAFDIDPRCISDADIASSYFCAKAPLDVTLPVPEGTTTLITVGNAKCEVSNATLTSDGEHLRYYKVTPGATSVRILHPQQPHVFLNEVIFK